MAWYPETRVYCLGPRYFACLGVVPWHFCVPLRTLKMNGLRVSTLCPRDHPPFVSLTSSKAASGSLPSPIILAYIELGGLLDLEEPGDYIVSWGWLVS